MSMSRLVFAPYDPKRDGEVRKLFTEYSHKDHQLRAVGVTKKRMVDYLEKTLAKPNMQSICLRDEGELVGLIALQSLPWMSEHFGLRMYAVPHLLAGSGGPLVRARLLRYVIEELPDVDFLDCRVAVDDVYSAHALEICGFRYVGAEIYLGQMLEGQGPPAPHPDFSIDVCTGGDPEQVVEIATDTHVHNRFVYDPIIREDAAKSLYRRLVTNCFDQDQFDVLVGRSDGIVQGFIISKISPSFSEVVGKTCGSLDFIGVRPSTRNRGLGAALNRWALHSMARKGAVFAAVRTLASNYAALANCYGTGFKVTSTSLHFHRWIHRPARSTRAVNPSHSAGVTQWAPAGMA
ncbi:MAG: GNAT family N-acetyltransferase [Deltaproteobacteria bacterium]